MSLGTHHRPPPQRLRREAPPRHRHREHHRPPTLARSGHAASRRFDSRALVTSGTGHHALTSHSCRALDSILSAGSHHTAALRPRPRHRLHRRPRPRLRRTGRALLPLPARSQHTAIQWPSGPMLMTGGYGDAPLPFSEVFSPNTPAPAPLAGHSPPLNSRGLPRRRGEPFGATNSRWNRQKPLTPGRASKECGEHACPAGLHSRRARRHQAPSLLHALRPLTDSCLLETAAARRGAREHVLAPTCAGNRRATTHPAHPRG